MGIEYILGIMCLGAIGVLLWTAWSDRPKKQTEELPQVAPRFQGYGARPALKSVSTPAQKRKPTTLDFDGVDDLFDAASQASAEASIPDVDTYSHSSRSHSHSSHDYTPSYSHSSHDHSSSYSSSHSSSYDSGSYSSSSDSGSSSSSSD